MENVRVSWDEAKEIAAHILKVPEDAEDDYAAIEDALIDKWEIGIEQFQEICTEIFNLVDFGLSPLSGNAYVGLAKPDEWIVKKDMNNGFLAGIVKWAMEDIADEGDSVIKAITCGDELVAELVVLKPGTAFRESVIEVLVQKKLFEKK